MVTASLSGVELAKADESSTAQADGNYYFPHDSINKDYFKPSERDLHTTCPWKGKASYYDIHLSDGVVVPDAAWFYPDCKAKELENKVAFYKSKGIRVE